MTLADAVAALESLDEEETIYASRPWAAMSACVVAPTGSKPAGFEYFLDAGTAREVLEALDVELRTPDNVLRLLMHYAEHDAYPRWLGDLG